VWLYLIHPPVRPTFARVCVCYYNIQLFHTHSMFRRLLAAILYIAWYARVVHTYRRTVGYVRNYPFATGVSGRHRRRFAATCHLIRPQFLRSCKYNTHVNRYKCDRQRAWIQFRKSIARFPCAQHGFLSSRTGDCPPRFLANVDFWFSNGDLRFCLRHVTTGINKRKCVFNVPREDVITT